LIFFNVSNNNVFNISAIHNLAIKGILPDPDLFQSSIFFIFFKNNFIIISHITVQYFASIYKQNNCYNIIGLLFNDFDVAIVMDKDGWWRMRRRRP
jgi:hypothetical protein